MNMQLCPPEAEATDWRLGDRETGRQGKKPNRLITKLLNRCFINRLIAVCLLTTLLPCLYAEKYESYRLTSGQAVDVVPGQVLVKFKKGISAQRRAAVYSAFNSKRTDALPPEVDLVRIPAGQSVESAVKQYGALSEVEYAEPNYIRRAFATPNDTYYQQGLQWGLAKIQAPSAWDETTGSDTVIVAVVDSGVDYNHPDLAYNIWPSTGYDFIANNDASTGGNPTEDTDPKDEMGHGTHVVGIIAAVTNNSAGVAGVAGGFYPQRGCRIMAVRVLNANGDGTDFTVSKGIVYAANNGAKIINLSLGGVAFSHTLKAAVDYAAYGVADSTVNYAYSKGCILVAASGNGGSDGVGDPQVAYPAAYDNVIAVGAVDSNDVRASFSNYGPELAIVAPGQQIYSTMPTYTVTENSKGYSLTYSYMSGTSMATPMVAGVVALMISKKPLMTQSDVRTALINTTNKNMTYTYTNGWNNQVGYGRVNAANAVGWVAPTISETVAKTGTSEPNPFKPSQHVTTKIYLPSGMSTTSIIKLNIFNIAGERVRSIEDSPGSGVVWDGRNEDKEIVAEGMYLYTIESGGERRRGKLTIIK